MWFSLLSKRGRRDNRGAKRKPRPPARLRLEVQRLEDRFEKREECRKQADEQKLGPIERIVFVRKCLQ